MGLRPGGFKAYPRRQGAVAADAAYGKGPEDQSAQGKTSHGVMYKEQVNSTDRAKITGFIQRAAAALSVNKSELIIEDSRGIKMLGESHELGSNVSDSIPRLM